MNRDSIDLRELDPERDPDRWEALLRRTRAAAAGELARRAHGGAAVIPLARWVRPALSLAAALVIAAAGALALTEPQPSAQPQSASRAALAEAMGVPVAMTGWAVGDASARGDQVLVPYAGESR